MTSSLRGPLAGLRVLDLTDDKGHHTTKLLADLSADVIQVEPPGGAPARRTPPFVADQPHPDRSLYVWHYNTSKRSLVLDLDWEVDRGRLRDLVAGADVLVETYPPGYLDTLDLGYAQLAALNPRLIVTSITGFGQTGPWRDYRTFGPTLQAMAGLTYLTAFPESGPLGSSFALADHVGGMTAALAALEALEHRRRTGEGQLVDLAQYEATCALLETGILDYMVNGRDAKPLGNHSPAVAPHNVYPCLGDDCWIALAVFSDADWQSLDDLAGQAWARDSRFATNEGRLAHQVDLDRAIAEWTATQPAEDLMDRLQRAGLCAGVVQTAEDLVEHDPQLRARGFFVAVDHPVIGRVPVDGPAFRLSEKPPSVRTAAPLLGQHTAEVLTRLLGLSQTEVDQLAADGVI